MSRSLLGFFVALSFLLVAPGQAGEAASPVLSRIVKSGVLRVGMSGNQPPLNMKNKEGEIVGLEPDLVRLLASSMGVEAKIVTRPFPELLGTLAAGEVDMVMSGLTITPERNLEVAFVGPYFASGKSILTKSRTLATAHEAGDIDKPDLKLVALEGSTSQLFVEKVVPNAKLITAKSYDEAVQLVIDDKVDAMVADLPICAISVLRHPEAGLATLLKPLNIEPIGIALPPNDPLLLNLVQNYLTAIQGTGVSKVLAQKWLEDGSWIAQLPEASTLPAVGAR